jgi:FkbM family methyltransferase
MKPLRSSRKGWDDYIYGEWNGGAYYKAIRGILGNAPIKTVVDIGANIGCSALFFMDFLPIEKLICIEPDLENVKLLQDNLEGFNGVNVEIHPVGVYYGKESSRVRGIGDGNPGGYMVEDITSSHVPDSAFNVYEGKIFKLKPLEEIIGDMQVDLIKLDVEGSEYNIIENSTAIKNAKYLLLEMHSYRHKFYMEFINKHLGNFAQLQYNGNDIYSSFLMRRK